MTGDGVLQGVALKVETPHHHGGVFVHVQFKQLAVGEGQHFNWLGHGFVVATEVVRALAGKEIFQEHSGKRRRAPMARYIRQNKHRLVLAHPEVVSEVAA